MSGNMHDESFQAKNAAPGTFGPFALTGGTYEFALDCTGTPAASLQKLMPGGTNFVDQYGRPNTATPGTYIKSLVTADKIVYPDLAPGTYQVVIGTSTANYFSLTKVPQQ